MEQVFIKTLNVCEIKGFLTKPGSNGRTEKLVDERSRAVIGHCLPQSNVSKRIGPAWEMCMLAIASNQYACFIC